MTDTPAMREHIRELVRFALIEAPEDSDADKAQREVHNWLDATGGAPPSPDVYPVRIAVDVTEPLGREGVRIVYLYLESEAPTRPYRPGSKRTIVLANVDVPEPPRETVGTVETNPTQGETL